jgi:hypothetical protein
MTVLQAFEDKIKDLLSGAPPFAGQPKSASSGSVAKETPSGSSFQGLLFARELLSQLASFKRSSILTYC